MMLFYPPLRWLITLIIIGSGFTCHSQHGNPFIHNYTIPLANLSHSNTAVEQGQNGVMYFANARGVLTYDGAQWNLIPTPSTPYSLKAGAKDQDRMYVGCRDNFGYLQFHTNGHTGFVSLAAEEKNIGNITSIGVSGSKIYFLNAHRLFEVESSSGKITHSWQASGKQIFTRLLILQEQAYVSIAGKGLQRIAGKQLQLVPGTQMLANIPVTTDLLFDKQHLLLVTARNQLYLFDGKKLQVFKTQAQSFLEANVLTGGTNLSPFELALSTVSGGCLIIDKQSGKIRNTVNFQTGLPDDEILSVGTDRQGGLWICHELGVSRADTRLPLENYSSYPGLIGNLTQVLQLNNTLYVATTEGVFYLDRVNTYQEVSGLVKQKQQIQQITKTITITESRKGIDLSFLSPVLGAKRNRKVETSQQVDVVNVEDDHRPSRNKSEIYALQSIPFVFKRVEGFTGKCKQLVEFNGQVLAAGSNGVFAISNHSARTLIASQYVNFMYRSSQQATRLYIGTNTGLLSLLYQAGDWQTENYTRQVNRAVHYIHQQNQQLWLGCENVVLKLNIAANGALTNSKEYSVPNQYSESIPVFNITGKPAFLLASGVHRYEEQADKLILDENLTKALKSRLISVYGQNELNWLQIDGRWQELSGAKQLNTERLAYLNVFNTIAHIFVDAKGHIWLIGPENTLFKIDAAQHLPTKDPLIVHLNRVTDKEENALPLDEVEVDYDHNTLNFYFSTHHYGPERAIQYQFKVDGIGNEWSNWREQPSLTFPVLPNGSYSLSVRARDAFGQVGEAAEFSFTIHPPFWKSWWFQLLILAAIIAGVYSFFKYRTHKLEKANRILEDKVQERTAQVIEQKDQIVEQKQALEVAYVNIEKKNKHITSSINYAQKIQQAILPVHSLIEDDLADVFVLFKPRDIVSGDFYWFSKKGEYIVIAAVDCTGHGVPGAFMSMIGNTLLNQIVNEKNIIEPAQILNHLHKGVRKALNQASQRSERQDGMDITICTLHTDSRQLQFAGANNPLYLIRNGVLEEIKGNKFGIGGLQKEEERLFTNHSFTLTETTHCYLFSDGYADQFGGPENKKFMSKRFKQLLVDICHKPIEEQKQILNLTIDEWKGEEHQLDDMLVIGFKVPALIEESIKSILIKTDTFTQLN